VLLAVAAAYLLLAPPAADLAAAVYRSNLFAHSGFATWDTGWYAAHGHWLPGYSLLSPELGALLGVRTLLALSAVFGCVLFALVAERAFGAVTGRVAAGVFALGFCVGMLSGRVPYYLGFALGLAALLALLRKRLALALPLAALTGLASPVAGAFLALAGVAWALAALSRDFAATHVVVDDAARHIVAEHAAGHVLAEHSPTHVVADDAARHVVAEHAAAHVLSEDGTGSDSTGLDGTALPRGRWVPAAALVVSALAPIVLLAILYPEGGYEPFAPSAFWPALAGVLLFALLLPHGPLSLPARRALRIGSALYALTLIAAYVLHTPMGGNAARLGPLLAAPLLTGVLWERRRSALALLAPALLYWQLVTPVHDLVSIAGDPSVNASYYTPLLAELRLLEQGQNVTSTRELGNRADGRAGAGSAVRANRPTIVEVPLTLAHWEAAYLAGAALPGGGRIELARGWERQLDTRYAALFYRPKLTASAYRGWLAENRVAYVALPDVPLDNAGRREGALVARGLPYLRAIWRSAHWQVYRFIG
jgi:hypothetical protein